MKKILSLLIIVVVFGLILGGAGLLILKAATANSSNFIIAQSFINDPSSTRKILIPLRWLSTIPVTASALIPNENPF